jgi:arylsulfatase A-like enzyme
MEGIFIAYGENIGRRMKVEGAQLVDLAPTILYALGMAIPEDMDGRILLEIFEPSFLASQKPRSSEALSRERRAAQGLTAEEEKEIKDKLRGLGYLS